MTTNESIENKIKELIEVFKKKHAVFEGKYKNQLDKSIGKRKMFQRE